MEPIRLRKSRSLAAQQDPTPLTAATEGGMGDFCVRADNERLQRFPLGF